jgi:hydrogenase/urease accessory protein HupE
MKLPHLLSTTACSLSSAVAFAHEGHGDHADALDGVMHWLTQWDHFVVLLLVAAAVGACVRALLQFNKTDKVQR